MKLEQHLQQGPDRGQFYAVVEMTHALAGVATRRRMNIPDVMDAVLLSLVSLVQAVVPVEEWETVGRNLADELRRRLAVKGDTGPDDYWRRHI